MRRALLTSLVAASTAFLVLAGLRLNSESIALVIGIGLGLLASLPAHLTLYRLATRSMIPVAPPGPPPMPPSPSGAVAPPLPAPYLPRAPRHFITIGTDEHLPSIQP